MTKVIDILKGIPFENPADYNTCSVCGYRGPWSRFHRHIARNYGEEKVIGQFIFVVCSERCHNASRPMYIDGLSSLPGWTRNAAANDWDIEIAKAYHQ